MTKERKFGWKYRVNSVSHPTEPANYTGSYTAVSKEILDIEITMHQSAGIITTMMELLLKLTLSEGEGGLSN